MLSLVHMNNRDHKRAIAYGEQAVAIDPGSQMSTSLFSLPLSYSGRPIEGLDMINRAMRLNPIRPGWYFHPLGTAYLFLGQYKEAIENYEECLKRLPEYIWCNVNLVVTYMEADREEDARTQANEVLRINPKFDTETAVQVRRIKDPATRERWRTLLRQAGLP